MNKVPPIDLCEAHLGCTTISSRELAQESPLEVLLNVPFRVFPSEAPLEVFQEALFRGVAQSSSWGLPL